MAYNIGDKIATRDAYGATLVEIGNESENLVVLDADLAAATKTGMFKKAHPDRFFDCGIAENNMIGAAVGLALSGKVPFAATFAMFAAGRSYEQVMAMKRPKRRKPMRPIFLLQLVVRVLAIFDLLPTGFVDSTCWQRLLGAVSNMPKL